MCIGSSTPSLARLYPPYVTRGDFVLLYVSFSFFFLRAEEGVFREMLLSSLANIDTGQISSGPAVSSVDCCLRV